MSNKKADFLIINELEQEIMAELSSLHLLITAVRSGKAVCINRDNSIQQVRALSIKNKMSLLSLTTPIIKAVNEIEQRFSIRNEMILGIERVLECQNC